MRKHSYYTNGVITRRIYDGDPIPEGFVKGVKPKSEEEKQAALEKRKKTNLERYGVEFSSQNAQVKDKAVKTCIAKYGAVSPSQSQEIKEKKKHTCLQHFGVEHPMQSKEVQEKSKQASVRIYGTEHPSQSGLVKDKVRNTSLERYGTEYPAQSKEVKDKAKKTCSERYGVENPSQSQEIKEKKRKTSIKRYGVSHYSKTDEYKDRMVETCMKKYGVEWPCMRPEARVYSNDSNPNKEFAKLLDSQGIEYEREFHISHFSYDFKVGNILIEIDPYATHNVLWGIFNEDNKKSMMYHYEKSQVAEQNGYHCIHIFDWDNSEKIVHSLLLPRERVYARDMIVCGLDKVEFKDFLNENHIQGSCNGQSVCLGLKDKYGEIVSMMSFGKPRYNRNFEWELLRYCTSKLVVGGAIKLFTHFIRDYNPKSIISYCDRSKFRGDVYKKLGFKVRSQSKPSKHWYSPKENRHITDNLLRQRGYDQLFKESYGKGTSNEELIINRGYVPIYDCGQDSFMWEANKK